jgi:hypothetical protein
VETLPHITLADVRSLAVGAGIKQVHAERASLLHASSLSPFDLTVLTEKNSFVISIAQGKTEQLPKLYAGPVAPCTKQDKEKLDHVTQR